jgi:phosphocarrier protein HPr
MHVRTRVDLPKRPAPGHGIRRNLAEAVQDAVRRTVVVSGKHGLHMRVCAAIVSTVCKHKAKVTIHKGGQSEDAASILGLLSLAASCGTTLILSAVGPEAEVAMEAILPIVAGAGEGG